MATWSDIANAFGAKLKTLANSPVVDWENVESAVPAPLDPTDVNWPAMFIRPALIPSQPTYLEIGPGGQNLQVGVYQVSVFIQAGAGRAPIMNVVDAICTLFKAGTILTSGPTNIRTDAVWPSPAIEEPDWYHIPVSVQWFAYTDNV